MGFQLEQSTIGELLREMAAGLIQLPDFQRQYRWDDDRITELLLTVMRGHPMGVIMFLEAGGENLRFKPKPIEGVDPVAAQQPRRLLLDGQQRLTSLFQSLTGEGMVETVDGRGQPMVRRYFIDIAAAMTVGDGHRDVVRSLPADGVVRPSSGRAQPFEVATPHGQFAAGLMPVTALFGPGGAGSWLNKWARSAGHDQIDERFDYVDALTDLLVTPATEYLIPAIRLDEGTTKEAVATVFEKVNTGGLPLDVFELLTAMFAGDVSYFRHHGTDFRLLDDWKLTEQVLAGHPVLAGLRRTDFLQAVTLLGTLEAKQAHHGPGRPPAVSARREEILDLDLDAYRRWAPRLRDAFGWVAAFLRHEHIHTAQFVPYRSQLVALVVLRVVLGEQCDRPAVRERISQWFWCGVFGELYSGSTDTRLVRDVEEVPVWALASPRDDFRPSHEPPLPDTVKGRTFSRARLLTLRSRQSAAYRGLCALLMRSGLVDWAEGVDQASQGRSPLDVHLVFSPAWCNAHGVDAGRRDSIVNKTLLSPRSVALIGGASPAEYLYRLQDEAHASPAAVDAVVASHAIDPAALRCDDFDAFFAAREDTLIRLIEGATGKGVTSEDPGRFEAPEAMDRESPDYLVDAPA